MATDASAADQATDLLQKLSLETKTESLEGPEATKKKYGSVNSKEVANLRVSSCERSTPPLLPDVIDPNMFYLPNGYTPYYYRGYDGSITEWEDYPRYVNPDGVELPPPGMYGDNGSLMYHHGYGYPPYGAYPPAGSPIPTMGHDGQLYGPQHYQYPAYYQPPTTTNGPYTPTHHPEGDLSTSVAADKVPLPVETGNVNSNGIANGSANGSNGSAPLKPSSQNRSLASHGSYGRGVVAGAVPSSGRPDPRFGFDGLQSPFPWLDGPIFTNGQARLATRTVSSTVSTIPPSRNQNLHPPSHLMGLHPPSTSGGPAGFMNRMYDNRMYGQFGNAVRTGSGFGVNGYDSRTSGHGWLVVDNRYKPRGRGSGSVGDGNENVDGLNELNRGPRAGLFRNQKGPAPHITIAVRGQSLTSLGIKDNSAPVPDRDQYNRADFLVDYPDAKFFIIKSYSEDDIHKSIKYSVWSSTPNGNKKLDAGYSETHMKPDGSHIFLFFSVNTSGQFVGLAEMVGPVDFNKNVEYWQQDKWNGCFPVKWHIVKDVPNSLLKHITLENNDNKPVTNSRDTQEVKFEQGLDMLKIFKDYVSKTCILDDFGFYEARQKTIQEKKSKQQQLHKQSAGVDENGSPNAQILERPKLKNQVCDRKQAGVTAEEKDKGALNIKTGLQKPLDMHATPKGGERKHSEGNGLASVAGDAPSSGAKPVTEKREVTNGIANCY